MTHPSSAATIAQALQRQLCLIWVRRYLLLIPLIASIPIGIALSYWLPRTFVATTLLLLQEAGGGPLSGNSMPQQPYQTQDRLNGLQALLKSEHVLKAVVRELRRDKQPRDPKEWSLEIGELQRAISISMLSSEIIEVRLKGPVAEGLGKTLEAITARLLESLMAPEDVIITAPQVIVERRRDQLASIEREYREFVRHQESHRAVATSTADGQGQRLANLLDVQRHARDEIDALRNELKLAPGQAASLDGSIDAARARIAQLGSRSDEPRMDVSIAQKHLERLIELQGLERVFGERQREIDQLATTVAEGRQAETTAASMEEKRNELQASLQSAREKLVEAERRFGTRSAVKKFQILRAPEQITIIDPPKDPEFPLLRRGVIVLFAMTTGALLGLGLALVANLSDTRLRSADSLARITGAPLWGRLPKGA
ncbi:MAG: hypothetical protein SFW09_18790 [Hyphomicrobiaceae bacterium]|nr:hypothetical protein [Hyphomicrobiaceae bacterium]